MKIAFLTRYDAFTKFGGDTHQISIYKKYWEDLGHIVDVITTEKFCLSYDVFIVVNIDRFLESFHFLRVLHNKNLLFKTFILPIHHSYRQILDYEINKQQDVLSITTRFFGYFGREKLKSFLLSLLGRKYLYEPFIQLFLNHKKFLSSISNDVRFIFLAEGEKNSLEEDFNVRINRFILTRNGCDISDGQDNVTYERGYDILVSGRIEKRKNSLAIAQYFALNKKYNVYFAGQLNSRNKSYTTDFLQIVNSSDNISYLGKLDYSEMQKVFRKSKVHLSASWFEVSSLVDLEALSHGCIVISSLNGNTNELLGNKIYYIKPSMNLTTSLDLLLPKILYDYTPPTHEHIKSLELFLKENNSWEINSKRLLCDIIEKI